MISNDIKSFDPFYASYHDSFDKSLIFDVYFKCPNCGCVSCSKTDDLDLYNFFSGQYKCLKCGISSFNGKNFNYYHTCFNFKLRNTPQLSLF